MMPASAALPTTVRYSGANGRCDAVTETIQEPTMNILCKTLFAYSRLTTGAAAMLLASTAAQAETEDRALTDFNAIEVGGGIDLELTQGIGFSVVVETNEDGELDDITTDVRNGTLRIDREWR